MYLEKDSSRYNFHVAHYGHPSKFGFKDIDLWKAEKWDPEKLIALFKGRGEIFRGAGQPPRQFRLLRLEIPALELRQDRPEEGHRRRLGQGRPRRPGCASACRSTRRAPGIGTTSPRAPTDRAAGGVPYDGKLTKADGKGQWWEGSTRRTSTPRTTQRGHTWPHDGEPPLQAYCEKFFNRTIDLIDKYQPDLLYFDDGVLPLCPDERHRPAHRRPLLQHQHPVARPASWRPS